MEDYKGIERPPILDKSRKLSENVKALIIDKRGSIIGVILTTSEHTIIQLFDQLSPMIVYNKITKQTEIDGEVFPGDPKRILNRLIKVRVSGTC